MLAKYSDWIESHAYGKGDCYTATKELCEHFPELRRVRGWFLLNPPEGGLTEDNLRAIRRSEYGIEHWWCVTPEGAIVDPTLIQFDDFAYTRRLDGLPWVYAFREFSKTVTPAQYVAFREGVDPEPIGRCLYCGGYVWDRSSGSTSACSAECLKELCDEY